jgi:hypothetical protein
MPLKRPVHILLAASLALAGSTAASSAQETDPGRAPTGAITNPGDLLKEADGTEFRFSYFPSANRLRLLVLQKSPAFTRWELSLRRSGAAAVLFRNDGPLPMSPSGATLDVPPLDDGTYELTLALAAADGRQREITRTFTRRHFPWEAEALGQDRIVIPPFTPMAVNKWRGRVSCVLRDHDLAADGLWKQVTSQGVPLLSAPMRLEVDAAGKTFPSRGAKASLTEQAEDRVRGQAEWTAGPLRGRTDFDFEYDGLAKITLSLEGAPETVDALRLVIPLRTDETWLMHPVTDLLRFHYAGRIPDGEGTLFDYSGKTNTVRYTESGRPGADGKVWDSV